MHTNYIKCGDSAELLKELPNASIDMVITSPPYDDLRTYNGYTFDFKAIANQLYRVLKPGGVIVWIVADATINGSETGTSFKQALYFKEIGLNIHDTMIWDKNGFTATGSLQIRYASVFEYMFIFSKGKPKTFNPIKDKPNIYAGKRITGNIRRKDGTMRSKSNVGKLHADFGQRYNIWQIAPAKENDTGHPAPFPEQLIKDHIRSWTNAGDIVLDCFMGSGTTALACLNTDREYIGYEISQEYCDIANRRIEEITRQLKLW